MRSMREKSSGSTGWRGSPDVWLDAAHAQLIESGIDGVTILGLAKRLAMARTSFYWHFVDRQALLTALADRWASRTSAGLIAACESEAKTEAAAMLSVIGCFLADRAFDSGLEFAIRSWAQSDPVILERLHVEDARRLQALLQMFNRWGHVGVDAETRAHTVYLTQIGYISMRVVEPVSARLSRIPSYVQIYTGRAPEPAEIERFIDTYVEPLPQG